MKSKKILFFFYNRLNDPLLQSNIFQYILNISKNDPNEFEISIITFEDPDLPITADNKLKIKEEFKGMNINWHPLKWHKGDGLVIKAYDLLVAFFKVIGMRFAGYKHVVSLGSIAGSFIYLISRFIPINYYLYQYEPHSEYALDNKIWKEESLQFKLLNFFERRSVKACKVVSSGTNHMKKRLDARNVNKPFFKVASVVNDKLFVFSPNQREIIRNKYGITPEQKLILYPGKIGDLYADAKTLIDFLCALSAINQNYRFLLITPQNTELLYEISNRSDVFKKAIQVISPIAYSEMPFYLSAADIGIVSVLPGPSKKFISNIKVGEYLSTGLPYIICKGISEDDVVTLQNNVGVVLQNLTASEVNKNKQQIAQILDVPKSEMAERCRKIGIEYRGFDNQFYNFKSAIHALLK